MKESVEYQIFVGCNDPQVNEEIVCEQELKRKVNTDTILITKSEIESALV